MAKFRYKGDQPLVFTDLQAPDGSTVEAQPGLSFDVWKVLNPHALLHDLIEAVDTEAKRLVKEAQVLLEKHAAEVVIAEPAPPVEDVAPDSPERT